MITKISIIYAPVPYIVLERDNIITANGTQQDEIDFNELSAYIAILTQQQTALGKYVNFFKGAFTVNNRNFDAIVIQPSDTPEPGTGAGIIVQLSNDPANPCAVTPTLVYCSHGAPLVPGDFLFSDTFLAVPLTGFDRIVDTSTGLAYLLNTLTGEVGALTGSSCTTPPVVVPPTSINFQLNGVDFTADNALSVDANATLEDEHSVTGSVNPCTVFFEIPMRGFGSFNEDYGNTISGGGGFMDVVAERSQTHENYWACLGYCTANAPAYVANMNIVNKAASSQTRCKFTIENFGAGDNVGISPYRNSGGLELPGATQNTIRQAQGIMYQANCEKPLFANDGMSFIFAYASSFGAGADTAIVLYKLNGVIVSIDPAVAFVAPQPNLNTTSPNLVFDEIVIQLQTTPAPGDATASIFNLTNPTVNTSDITAVEFGALFTPLVGYTPPTPGGGSDNGDYVAAATVDFRVVIQGTSVNPSIVRIKDSGGVDHDLPYTADGNYDFVAIPAMTGVQIYLIP